MRTVNGSWGVAVTFLLAGCAASPTAQAPKQASPAAPAPAPLAEKSAPATPQAKQAPETDAVSQSSVPENLKHDGYAYFGLGYDKAIDFSLKTTGQSGVQTGSSLTTLTGVKDGIAHFEVTRTGGLTAFGEKDELICTPEGVYTVATSMGKLKGKHLELPAKVGPGATWKDTTVLTLNDGRELTTQEAFKVKGVVHLKTAVAAYDALEVDSVGAATVGSQKARTESKYWFVKGKGPVKMEIESFMQGKSVGTTTLEETQ